MPSILFPAATTSCPAFLNSFPISFPVSEELVPTGRVPIHRNKNDIVIPRTIRETLFIAPHLHVTECVADAGFNLSRIRFGSPPPVSQTSHRHLIDNRGDTRKGREVSESIRLLALGREIATSRSPSAHAPQYPSSISCPRFSPRPLSSSLPLSLPLNRVSFGQRSLGKERGRDDDR